MRLETFLTNATQTQYSTSDLINAAVEWLVREKVEMPALNTLRRICGRVNSASHRAIEKKVMVRITDETRAMLDTLLHPAQGQLLAKWTRIRERPGAPTLHALRAYLDFAEWVWGLGTLSDLVVDVPKPKLRHYSAEARELAASDLINFGATDHRYVIMIAAIVEAQQHARDALARFFCKRMAQFEKEAQADVDEAHLRQWSLVERVVTVFRDVLVALEEKRPIKLVKAIWAIILLAGSRESLITECDHILGTVSLKDRFETFMWRHFKSNRAALFQLVRSLPLRATTGDASLLEATQAVLRNESADSNYRPRDFDLAWASEAWRMRVLASFEGKPVYRRDALELCVFTHLARDLRSGDIAVLGSAEHADYRDQLLAWPETAEKLGDYAAATGISCEPESFVADLKHRLEKAIADADHKLNAKPLGKRRDGDWTLKRYAKRLPSPQFAALEATVQHQLDDRGLIEILVNADGLTRFTQHFGPPAGTAPKIQEARKRHLITTFAYGTGLGPAQVAKHLREGLDPKDISYANRHHFSSEQLARANAEVVNYVNRFPLSAVYGSGQRAGADGTYVAIRDKNLMAEYHFRYRKSGGIKHQLVSDKYVALFSTFIPCSAWEATYLLDMVLGNKSDIQPKIIHGDTQSQTAPILGLAYLLGIDVRPRIRRWKDIVLYKPDSGASIGFLQNMWRGTIDWDLIASQFRDVLRVVISIQQGKIIPSNLLKHLGTYSRRNRLYQAIREIGRVIRTMVILDYVTNEDEQRAIQKVTNMVESYNRFNNWFVIGERGVIRDNDPDEFDKRVKYRDLIANCAVLQNIVDLTRTFKNLMAQGHTISRQDIQQITPYLTAHIKRFGEFDIDLSTSFAVTDEDMQLPLSLIAST